MDLPDISFECLLLNIRKDSNNWFININGNWLSAKKYKVEKLAKRSGFEISNIMLKRIKEYSKVTHHREKWFWTKNSI